MDEFGMGSSSSNSAYGSVVNPWTPPGGRPLCAGGSSGGAAALVAAGIVDGKGTIVYVRIV
jgi:aspartyl-tRNA(Asn)/glutamyl-tRNA(Gln) amidotransferase subunit A